MIYDIEFETMPREALAAIQLQRLKASIERVYATVPYYRKKLDAADIAPGDIRAGALSLLRAVQYVPQGVMLAVVDPGVGTNRKPIAASTPWGVFIGPDNGLLAPAVAMVGGADQIHEITNPELILPANASADAVELSGVAPSEAARR